MSDRRRPRRTPAWSPKRSAAARRTPGSCRVTRLVLRPTKQLLGMVAPVDLTYSAEDQAFRAEVRAWLEEHLTGEWAALRGLGGAGRDHEAYDERLAWNRLLAEHGWTCVGWPDGARRPRAEPVAAGDLPRGVRPRRRARAGQPPRRGAARPDPDRVRHRRAEGSGSCRRSWPSRSCGRRATPSRTPAPTWPTCRPRRASTGDEWVIDGQKVWTSNAHFSRVGASWSARTEPGSERHHGLSFLLVPLDQDGVEVRPIEQLTGGSEFNEVFFTGARTAADLVVGEPGEGWGVAMALLGFERGVSTLGQPVGFARELDGVVDARAGQRRDRRPGRCATGWRRLKVELEVMRRQRAARARRSRDDRRRRAALDLQAGLGQLAPAARRGRDGRRSARPGCTAGPATPYDLDAWQRLFLFSRADTIYGGSDEIQRNILAERVLGLPERSHADDRRPDPSSRPPTTCRATTCWPARSSS